MKKLSIAVLAMLLVGCGDAAEEDPTYSVAYGGVDDLTFEFVFEPDPPQTGAVDLEMQIKHDGEILEGATVQVEPWMPSHDHGSDTEAVVHEEGDGWYHVDELTFSMEGSWDLVFDIAEGDRERQVVLGVLVED